MAGAVGQVEMAGAAREEAPGHGGRPSRTPSCWQMGNRLQAAVAGPVQAVARVQVQVMARQGMGTCPCHRQDTQSPAYPAALGRAVAGFAQVCR